MRTIAINLSTLVDCAFSSSIRICSLGTNSLLSLSHRCEVQRVVLRNQTLVLKSPKTDSSNRIIYLPQAVIEELKEVKLKQAEYKSMLGNEYHDYDLVIAHINGRPYEMRIVDLLLYKMIEKHKLRPIVFHSLRHSSTSLKLKLSRGNIKAVQGDTGHAEARMVTDTYAHGFDADRKLIAQEMDSGFFSKVGADSGETDDITLNLLKNLIKEKPELVADLLSKVKG